MAELAFAAEAARLGLSVYKPLTEHERCDLIIGAWDRLLRVQCKRGAHDGGVVYVRLIGARHFPTRGYVTITYQEGEIDAVGVYCGDLDRCYLVPGEKVFALSRLHLRLTAPRNNQAAALNWAADYELSGAVAQLEERRAGSAKVRGSSPLSSTTAADAAESESSSPQVVGAHRFRNHFGYYLERASRGAEVLVERRGKPYAPPPSTPVAPVERGAGSNLASPPPMGRL